MKALTILQPWAELIRLGIKTIETRTWYSHFRGELVIHAGKRRPERAYPELPGMAFGAAVAVVNVVDWRLLTAFDEPAACCECAGRYGAILANVRPLRTPIPCKGAQSLWTVPDDVAALIRSAMPVPV